MTMSDEKKKPEDLRSRTKALALRIVRLYEALPKSTAAQVLGRQMLRSGTSVGANYREAYRARSKAEFVAKIGDCLRELDDTGYWLELLGDASLVQVERLADLRDEVDQLIAILTTIAKKTKRSMKDEG